MARDHARIYVKIWADADFRALEPVDQWTYFALISSPKLSYCGVLDFIPSRLAVLAAGLSVDEVDASVRRLVKRRFVVVDDDTSELLVRSYVRHDGIFKQPNVVKAMLSARRAVLSGALRDALDAEIARAYQEDPEQRGFAQNGIPALEPELWERMQKGVEWWQ